MAKEWVRPLIYGIKLVVVVILTVEFKMACGFNQHSNATFTLLNHGIYGSATFSKVRLLTSTTYDPMYLEVYVEKTGTVYYSIKDEYNDGLDAIDWTSGVTTIIQVVLHR